MTDFQFYGVVAHVGVGLTFLHQIRQGLAVLIVAAGHVAGNGVAGAAQQFVHRHVGRLAFDVPEGDVDRRHPGHYLGPAPARCGPSRIVVQREHLVPQPLVIQRVLAQESGLEDLGHHPGGPFRLNVARPVLLVDAGKGHTRSVSLADAHQAGVRVDPYYQLADPANGS